ncbi:MAG: indole-3-glycerol phosphate synthase TrpC [Cyclobacteriaceae bacterium]
MNILEEIIAHKKKEVAERKEAVSIKALEFSPYFDSRCTSARAEILDPMKSGIIAEFKRKSPSKGIINDKAKVQDVVKRYKGAGVSAVSVLTDSKYFGGDNDDLIRAREAVRIPILRKDFIVDEYQLIEAKSIGADFILLIAAALTSKEVDSLSKFAKALGLEVLMEVHSKKELDANLFESIDLIGINNRNLKTFETTIETSLQLVDLIPDEFVKISESGISKPETIVELKSTGFHGFLIGENFMASDDPGKSCMEFIEKLSSVEKMVNL